MTKEQSKVYTSVNNTSPGKTEVEEKAEFPQENQQNITQWDRVKQEMLEIIQNRYFFCCLCGSICNNFALGGLADWFPAFFSPLQ